MALCSRNLKSLFSCLYFSNTALELLCSSNNTLVNKVVWKLRDSKNVGGGMGTELRPLFLSTETVDCGLTFFLLNIAVMEKLCSCKLCMLF